MSKLPNPRNIQKNWTVRPISIDRAMAEIAIRRERVAGTAPFPERFGRPVEVRAWEMARGWRKGQLKRVDIAFEGEGCFVSLRLTGGIYFNLKYGAEACK